MRKNFHEIFEEVEIAPSTAKKIDVLRKNFSPQLVEFLRNVYNPNVRYCIKELPKYKVQDQPLGMSYTSIDQELKRAYLFEVVHPKKPANITSKRLEELLIQVLENLETKEAKIFGDMLHKKLDYPSMSRALAETAFPNTI